MSVFSDKKSEIHSSVNRLYNLLENKRVAGEKYHWLNLGYWKNSANTQSACQDLIQLVAEYACIQNSRKILDVGFGFGIQDIFIANQYPHCEIHGVNIVENQIEEAKELVSENNLSNRIFLQKGDATQLDYDDETFDKVIAIESAFHFYTREVFFKEAYRVLKKGGALCLAEGLPNFNKISDTKFIERSRFLGIPIENQYEISVYINKLKDAGFTNIEYLDVSEWVVPFGAFVVKQPKGWRFNEDVCIPDKETLEKLISEFKTNTTIDKYYVVKSIKA
jgi:microcystin synthetase protein McyJ